jgi:glutaredoxin
MPLNRKATHEIPVPPDSLAAGPDRHFRRLGDSPQKQAELDATTSSMQLYQFQMCPFCVKTRRAIRRLGLNIETRDARNDPQWSNELVNQGGRYQVPCLRVVKEDGSIDWIYESNDIIGFLDRRFGS